MNENWIIYNKLVRDKVPKIIESTGKLFEYRTLELNEDYRVILSLKMDEEIGEYLDSPTKDERIEELADVLEVFQAMLDFEGYDLETINKIREEKKITKGGFENRNFLVKVSKN